MNRFHDIRLKLTVWYLLIIMTISILFSLVIYRALSSEIDRFERAQRVFVEKRVIQGDRLEMMEGTRQRILLLLVFVNTGIFVITGGLGFLLAGKTLALIKEK